jgi:SAM-dependent methyltransferase
MRLETIEKLKAQRSTSSQSLYPAREDLLSPLPADDFRPSIKRLLSQGIAPVTFPLKRWWSDRQYSLSLNDWPYPLVMGHRFTEEWLYSRFEKLAGGWAGKRVLIPGANFNSSDARKWFPRPIELLHILDIVNWGPSFVAASNELTSLCCAPLSFYHGTLDKIPLPDASIDIVETAATLEHVGNMEATAAELARVMTPNGLAFHGFGPLYFGYGGDHCIPAIGFEHGFDHLLLDDDHYHKILRDDKLFNSLGMEAYNARYWAIQGIFSYLKPREYIDAFKPWFDIVELITVISNEAITFRESFPDSWQRLIDSGVAESDLLITGIFVLLRRNSVDVKTSPS